MRLFKKITPCLWFEDQAQAAANTYIGIFQNSRITHIERYGEVGHEYHGKPAGSVMTVAFELDGQPFTALNGGPIFRFNEAVSFQIFCDTQQEVDHYWNKLSAGGRPGGPTMRLAQGPLRPVLASGADRAIGNDR